MYHTSGHFQGNFVRLMIGSTLLTCRVFHRLGVLQRGAWNNVGPEMTKRGLCWDFGMARELGVYLKIEKSGK